MAIDLKSISKGMAQRAPRILLVGTPKVGKSTFASQADDPIFIPIKGEEGIDYLDTSSFPTATTFNEVLEMIGVLYTEDHDYKTVVIDSASALETLVWAETCRRDGANSIEKVNGGYGKGYTECLIEWGMILDGLDALRDEKGMASIIIGHVRVKSFNDPTADAYDQYQFNIQSKAAEKLSQWADCTLFAQRKAIVKKEELGSGKSSPVKRRAVADGEPVLRTQERPAHPGGGRGDYGRLPYELELSWPAFINAVNAVRTANA